MCLKKFTVFDSLKKHVKSKHVKTPTEKWKCDYCPKIFHKKGFLAIHLSKIHPEKSKTRNKTQLSLLDKLQDNSSNHTCSKCKQQFPNLLTLAKHFNEDHETTRWFN